MPTLHAAQLDTSVLPPSKQAHAKSLPGNGLITAHFYPCVIPLQAQSWWNNFTGRNIMAQARYDATMRGWPDRVQQKEVYCAEGEAEYAQREDAPHVTCHIDCLDVWRGRIGIMASDLLRINPRCESVDVELILGGVEHSKLNLSRLALGERQVFLDHLIDITAFNQGLIKLNIRPRPWPECHPPIIVFEFPFTKNRGAMGPRASHGPVARFSLMWSENELSKERALYEMDEPSRSSSIDHGRAERQVTGQADREEPSTSSDPPSASKPWLVGFEGDATDQHHVESSLDVRKALFPTWFASADGEGKSQGQGSNRARKASTPSEPPSQEQVKKDLERLEAMRRQRYEGMVSKKSKMQTAWIGVVVGGGGEELGGTGV